MVVLTDLCPHFNTTNLPILFFFFAVPCFIGSVHRTVQFPANLLFLMLYCCSIPERKVFFQNLNSGVLC